MGVANERSIAWGIARVLAGQGAKLAFTYQGDAFGRRAIPLAKSVGSEIIVSCDVTDLDERRQRLRRDQEDVGRPRLRRACARLLRPARAVGALLRHHARELHQHHGDLLLLLHRDRQARRRADAERRLAADAHLRRLARAWCRPTTSWASPRRRWRRPCATSPPTSARRASASTRCRPGRCARWPAPASRMRACIFNYPGRSRAAAAHADARRGGRRRALSAVRPVGRRDRRGALRRLRLQHRRHADPRGPQGPGAGRRRRRKPPSSSAVQRAVELHRRCRRMASASA